MSAKNEDEDDDVHAWSESSVASSSSSAASSSSSSSSDDDDAHTVNNNNQPVSSCELKRKRKPNTNTATAPVRACMYCENNLEHPLFLYLLVDKRIDVTKTVHRDQLYVGLSSQPIEHVKCHNREPGYKAGVKSTKQNAGHWELEMCMQVRSHGKTHKTKWRKSKEHNKLTAVLRYIIRVAKQEHYVIYCMNTNTKFTTVLARVQRECGA